MLIRSAYIKLVEGTGPIKARMYLRGDDIIDNCEITGGAVCIEAGTDILFKACFIKDCKYSIKEVEEAAPPCPIVIGCTVKDCELPLGYYSGCYIQD